MKMIKIFFCLGSLIDLLSIMVTWNQFCYTIQFLLKLKIYRTDYKIKTNFIPLPRGQIALQLEKRGTYYPAYWLHLRLNPDKDVEIDLDVSIDVTWDSKSGEPMEAPTSKTRSFLLHPTPPGSATLDISVRVNSWVITEKPSLKRPHSEHSN